MDIQPIRYGFLYSIYDGPINSDIEYMPTIQGKIKNFLLGIGFRPSYSETLFFTAIDENGLSAVMKLNDIDKQDFWENIHTAEIFPFFEGVSLKTAKPVRTEVDDEIDIIIEEKQDTIAKLKTWFSNNF